MINIILNLLLFRLLVPHLSRYTEGSARYNARALVPHLLTTEKMRNVVASALRDHFLCYKDLPGNSKGCAKTSIEAFKWTALVFKESRYISHAIWL